MFKEWINQLLKLLRIILETSSYVWYQQVLGQLVEEYSKVGKDKSVFRIKGKDMKME